MRSRLSLLSCFMILTCFCACRKQTTFQPAFYYWKNDSRSVSKTEIHYAEAVHAERLYVKFFEVGNDPIFKFAPYAKTNLQKILPDNCAGSIANTAECSWLKQCEIIPVVFIKNEVFTSISAVETDTLAADIDHLIRKYYEEKAAPDFDTYREIQIDCDWTAGTAQNYFNFLQQLRRISGKQISCTLRLYPFKYRDKTGVPPADRVTLMCYNLVNPLQNENMNSILDANEFQKYISGTPNYPLHMDIALPVFGWMQLYRNHEFIGLLPPADIFKLAELKQQSGLWYEVQNEFTLGDIYIKPGDMLKQEIVDDKTIFRCIDILKENINFADTVTITLFHLDEKNLSQYAPQQLADYISAFAP